MKNKRTEERRWNGMIKIEMDMPESCAECPFEVYEWVTDYHFCAYTDALVTQMIDCRHKLCPLEEGDSE